MDIHHCPRCELRFVTTSELRHHFRVDHAADPRVFERYRYRPARAAPPARTVLLVGNQTLAKETLVDEVREHVGDAHVLVLVPATHSGNQDLHSAPPASDDATDAAGLALARWRLRTAVDRLRAAGVDADGEVGPADAYTAVCRALAHDDVDEIVLSTLPPSSSRWLDVDLPARLRRRTGLPVTVLEGAPTGTS